LACSNTSLLDIAEKQEFRKLPPSHYLSKFESFSTLLESTEIEQYVTNAFEAGGYKWLVLRTQTYHILSSIIIFYL